MTILGKRPRRKLTWIGPLEILQYALVIGRWKKYITQEGYTQSEVEYYTSTIFSQLEEQSSNCQQLHTDPVVQCLIDPAQSLVDKRDQLKEMLVDQADLIAETVKDLSELSWSEEESRFMNTMYPHALKCVKDVCVILDVQELALPKELNA